MKLIIPLLDPNIKLSDITKKAGFINGYTYNKNKPYLDNHIFLMYDANESDPHTWARETNLSKSKNLYGKEYIRANGNNYVLYSFVIINPDIKQLLKGLRHKKTESFARICNFWNGKDPQVNKYLCDLLPELPCSGESVPEEDYLMTHEECIRQKKNPEGLILDSQGLFCFNQLVIRRNTLFWFFDLNDIVLISKYIK